MSSITRHWFWNTYLVLWYCCQRDICWHDWGTRYSGMVYGIRCHDMSSQICMRIYCAHSCTNRTSDGISWSVELIWFFPRSSSSAVLVLRGQCIVDSGWKWTCYEARIFNCQQQIHSEQPYLGKAITHALPAQLSQWQYRDFGIYLH